MKQIIYTANGNVEEFFSKSYEEQMFLYFYKHDYAKDEFLRLDETEKNVVLTQTQISIVYSGGHFFKKRIDTGKFIYNKLEKKVKCAHFSKDNVLSALAQFPQFDWLKDSYEQKLVVSTLFCDSIVRDILLGKLTNAENIVKKYLRLNKIKGTNWKCFVNFLSRYNYPIAWVQSHTTNCNEAIKLLVVRKHNSNEELSEEEKALTEKSSIFEDMFWEALALNTRINPLWSLNRMKEEHTQMSRKLMEKDLALKESIDIYGDCPKFDYPCRLLSTEQEVYSEGMEMSHCVYTCYWNRIKQYEYLAFAFETPDRFTLGLKLNNNQWEYDQAYLKYDKDISEESKAMIERFLADSNVKETLERMRTEYSPIQEEHLEEDSILDGCDDLPF